MPWDTTYAEHLRENTSLTEGTIRQHISRLRTCNQWVRENATNGQIPEGNEDQINKYGHVAVIALAGLMRQYFKHLEDNHPADYRQHIKAALRRYYSFLIIEGAIKEMPDLDIPIRKNGMDRNKTEHILTSQNIEDIQAHFSDVQIRVMLECLIQLGVRMHELLLLRPRDFNSVLNQVTIRSTKTEGTKYGGQRIMPLPPNLYTAITIYIKAAKISEGSLLFKIKSHRVWKIMKEAGISLGMSWLHPHLFRHYCITRFSQLTGSDGVTPVFNQKELSMMFGVSPEIIASRYSHPSTENIVSKALNSGLYQKQGAK